MSTKSSFREAIERQAEAKENVPFRSGSPVSLNLEIRDIPQPVDFARFLRKCGLSLRKAHDVVDRVAAREIVPVELYTEDVGKLIADLEALGVAVRPITLPQVDPKNVRERLGLSQAEFAIRFGLELDTVQNWEQGRYRPDPAARLLLRIIDKAPTLVDEILTEGTHAGADE
jgi:DNA-binding transcriptional regulator YiaG